MKIFVGNLTSHTSEKQLEHLFTPYGAVRSVKIINDAYTGRSRGFAFVDMAERDSAEKAIRQLNSSRLNEQTINVSLARTGDSENGFGRRRN